MTENDEINPFLYQISKITDQTIDQAFSDFQREYGGVRNDYFAPLFLVNEHGLDLETALLHSTFGGNDYGFDAFYWDRKTGNLYLYQFKWTEEVAQFKASYRRMIDAGLDRIFVGSFQDPKQNQALIQLKCVLREQKAVVAGVYIRFVFRGDTRTAENSSVLAKLREDLEAKKYLIDGFFGREVNLVIDYRSAQGHIGGVTVATKTHTYALEFSASLQKQGPAGQLMHVGVDQTPPVERHV